jgi:hypothetical protein
MPHDQAGKSLLSTNESKQYRWDQHKISRKQFWLTLVFNDLKTPLNLYFNSLIALSIFLIFEIRGVLSFKTCLEWGNLVNLTIDAPWCITGCPSNIFHQSHMQRTSMGGSQGLVLQENHGGMWGKGAWRWLKAKTSSGRTNNASKGVDERVWAVQLVGHAVTKYQSEDECAGRKPEPGGA